jgi:hypothetical protein
MIFAGELIGDALIRIAVVLTVGDQIRRMDRRLRIDQPAPAHRKSSQPRRCAVGPALIPLGGADSVPPQVPDATP